MQTLLIFFTFFNTTSYSQETYVKHPIPQEPVYFKSELYNTVKKTIPLPPEINSDSQKADEKELLQLQNTRTSLQCENAKSEIFATFENFFGAHSNILDKKSIEKLEPLFAQLRNDGDFFIQKLKKEFPRKRPYFYLSQINPCITKESTGAYPSGHATLSKLYALVLSDLFPNKKSQFLTRAEDVGRNRVLAGVHHPSDIRAGQALANFLYNELKKSESFQNDFKKYSTLINSQ